MTKRWWLALLSAGLAVAALVAIASVASGAPDSSSVRVQRPRVAIVSDVGRFNDRSFNQSALEGCRRVARPVRRGGLGGGCIPKESRVSANYIPNLVEAATRNNAHITFSVGFLLANATAEVAGRLPNERFAIIDHSVRVDPFGNVNNVRGLTFATNENSYMIGCLSALMARRGINPSGRSQGRRIISAVGGIPLPTVTIFIAGYRAGARRCVPGTQVLVGYSNDFVAQDRCKEIALNQIAQGSRVVFQVAGNCGLGALDAARENNRWGLGVDKDQAFLGRHIMTSAVKRVDQSVFLTARDLTRGTYRADRDALYNLRNNGVAIGRISRRVPRAFVRQMNRLRPLIISGRIRPPRTLG